MSFNPPPGWPLPRDWYPPPDWNPDPSWPPAPAGWQFWSDAELQTPPATNPPSVRQPPVARPPRNLQAFALIAVAVVVVGGAVGVGMMLGNSGVQPEAGRASSGNTTTELAEDRRVATVPDSSSSTDPISEAQCDAGATDVLGDTELMYDDRGEYNRSDIVALTVHCADDQLTVTMTFAPGVDMTVAGFAALIDRDPDAGMQGGHACGGSDTDDHSISVDGSARGDSWSVLDTTSCQTPYPVVATGSSTTNGSSMAATVSFADLGVELGGTITLYAFSSTYLPPDLLDPGQDDIPDAPPLRIRIG